MLNHDETAKVRFASLAGGLLSTARVVIVIAASTGANPDRVASTLSRPIFSVPSAVGRFEVRVRASAANGYCIRFGCDKIVRCAARTPLQ